jgi:hypothetical protein
VSLLNVHEKEGNARKDAAELAEAQEQAASKRATAYGPLFNSGKLALTKKAGALKLKGWSRRVPVSAPLRPKIGPVLPHRPVEASGRPGRPVWRTSRPNDDAVEGID